MVNCTIAAYIFEQIHFLKDVFQETSASAFNNGQNPVPSSGMLKKMFLKELGIQFYFYRISIRRNQVIDNLKQLNYISMFCFYCR